MRRAAAGAGGGDVAVCGFRRWGRAVADDGRRTVVAPAEGDAWNVELGAPVSLQIFAGAFACFGALRRVVLDLRDRLIVAERIGKALGVRGVAHRERLALELVAFQQAGRGAAFQDGGELPAEIHRVLHCRVVAEAAGRREEVRRVAADEDAALGEALGHEGVSGGPGVARQHLDPERRADRLLHHRRGGRFVDARFVLVWLELRVKGELALAVDRRHERAALAVEAHVHPRRRVRHLAVEIRHAAIHRVHAPADEIARHAGLAGVAPAHALAHQTARTVGADEVCTPDVHRRAALGGLGLRLDVVAMIGKARNAPTVMNRGDALGVTAQHLLDEFLGHAVRQLRRAPRA